jgi:hypothetical protein
MAVSEVGQRNECGGVMQKEEDRSGKGEKRFAAVCGLYCEACRWFIATTEDPARLKILAAEAQYTEEENRCYGCRSEKRLPYCTDCKMRVCAAERGIDFCGECEEYPCGELKQFQSAKAHRIELWENLKRIRAVGYEQWLTEKRRHYTCPRCGVVNTAYDLQCRKCGEDPSCAYVAEHRQEIERFARGSIRRG